MHDIVWDTHALHSGEGRKSTEGCAGTEIVVIAHFRTFTDFFDVKGFLVHHLCVDVILLS